MALKREGGQTLARESLYCPTKKNERKVSPSSFMSSPFCQGLKDYPHGMPLGEKNKRTLVSPTKKEKLGRNKCVFRACRYFRETFVRETEMRPSPRKRLMMPTRPFPNRKERKGGGEDLPNA